MVHRCSPTPPLLLPWSPATRLPHRSLTAVVTMEAEGEVATGVVVGPAVVLADRSLTALINKMVATVTLLILMFQQDGVLGSILWLLWALFNRTINQTCFLHHPNILAVLPSSKALVHGALQQIILSRHVMFDEPVFPFGSMTPISPCSYKFLDTIDDTNHISQMLRQTPLIPSYLPITEEVTSTPDISATTDVSSSL